MSVKCADYDRQGFGQDFGEIPFFWVTQRKRQPLYRRAELRVHSALVPSGIHAIPAELRQVNGIKAVQRKGWSGFVETQALVAKSRRDSVSAQQGCQKVTFRVAVAGASEQYL